jgi:hypothetical protein
VSAKDVLAQSRWGADFGDSYGRRGDLYAHGLPSRADPYPATPFLPGQLGNLAERHRHYHDVGFTSFTCTWKSSLIQRNSMVVVHQYPPNYAASLQTFGTPQGPVVATANWPPGTTLYDRVNGLMNAVFAYGGATLFNELMAEMRRPYDFWKGFLYAEVFIFVCYLVTGMVVYSAQGQFSYVPAFQGEL